MGLVDDDFAAVAGETLDAFGEQIIYAPASGPQRTITAIVDRTPPAWKQSTGSTTECHIQVADSATSGVVAADVDVGGDAFLFPLRAGGSSNRTWRIASVNALGDGMVTLILR